MVHKRSVAQLVVPLAALCFWGAANLTFAADKDEEGFVSLFDGKTLNGWHLMNGAKFVVEDGVIKHNQGLGWLRSDKQYADFILRMEFRFMKPKQDGGVFLRAVKEGDNWPNQKYEVQVENTRRMAMLFGAKYDLNEEAAQKALKRDGEWNKYEIKIVASSIEVRLNGTLVTTSKSADALKRGYLGLQGENGAHEYRNFRIKDLSKQPPGPSGCLVEKESSACYPEPTKDTEGAIPRADQEPQSVVGIADYGDQVGDQEDQGTLILQEREATAHKSQFRFGSEVLRRTPDFWRWPWSR